MLQENKKTWHLKLKNALWVHKISTKKSIGTSPFQLVYVIEVVFPISLVVSIMIFLQEQVEEPNDMQRKINQLIEVQQKREEVYNKSQLFKIKKVFDKRTKSNDFQVQYLVLRWDARFEDKEKHGKFDHLWKGPYKIAA